jgi:branched-chain amino acid transport system ATP-binding protein
MLLAENITVKFGAFTAVDNVSLQVAPGELLGLAGTNGAGKSTLFSAIAGQTPLDAGRIVFDGVDISRQAVNKRAAHGLARTFQVPREFASLSVLDNLLAAAPNEKSETMLAAWLLRGAAARREKNWVAHADGVLALLNLLHLRDLPASGLSGGQKKLLELARIMMREPKVVLLDEPFAGVNPVLIGEIIKALKILSAKGIALVVVEHHLQALKSLVTRLVVMDQGRILAQGKPADVLDSEAVKVAYMGGVI